VGPEVRWRATGLLDPTASDGLLRFAVADLNMVINKAAADADLYRNVCAAAGRPGCEALVLSTYAVTDRHPVEALARAWPGRRFLTADPAVLLSEGIEIWPTAIFGEGVADPNNDVHFDVVVAVGPSVVPQGMAGTKSERRAARALLRPGVEVVLAHFSG
jgi:hypothetical protein